VSVDISFIVSCFDRPEMLLCCLASLNCQSHREIEVIVTDNSNDSVTQSYHKEYCGQLGAKYLHTGLPGCYHSAEVGAQYASGEYLCFPSDDGYMVPTFAEVMLKDARGQNLDLLICGAVYSPRWESERYHLMEVAARLNFVDKTNFILKRDKFIGFPDKTLGACAADGMLIDRLVASGIRHGVISDVMVVHN
jgi:glycosyltransferase involved in cell wall biosynthesis